MTDLKKAKKTIKVPLPSLTPGTEIVGFENIFQNGLSGSDKMKLYLEFYKARLLHGHPRGRILLQIKRPNSQKIEKITVDAGREYYDVQ